MKKRKGKYGTFMGCTGYPQCKHTMSMRDAAMVVSPPDDPNDIEYEQYRAELKDKDWI